MTRDLDEEKRATPTWEGGCHCGAVRFSVQAHLLGDEAHSVVNCNCSICTLKGFLHLIVQKDRFELHSSEGDLSLYTFGTHQAKHRFCVHCGIHSFYTPRSHPQGISVNVHALDVIRSQKMQVGALKMQPFDGQNWEENVKTLV